MKEFEFTHLLYVRKYSIFSNSYEFYVYGVNTDDIFHTMGEIIYRSEKQVERIIFEKLIPENRQSKIDFWKNEEIRVWKDRYK